MTVGAVWGERLGVDQDHASNELGARFEFLSRFVLEGGEMPPAATAEAATAFGDLVVLQWFLTDVRRVFDGQEVTR